jgi:hypothetical protein
MASAQAPAGPAPQGAAPGGRAGGAAPLQNIKVLPKTWTRQQVGAVMQSFTKSLGVMCDGCHVAEGTDRASDANPNKDVARKMIQMVMDINGDHLKGVGDASVAEKVSCWTCHQGQKTPAAAPPDGWGRGAFSLSEAGPTLPARGAGPGGPGPGGAPPARGN